MRTRIPDDWDINDPSTWILRSTVNQFQGMNAAGAPIYQQRDRYHRADDYEDLDTIERRIATDGAKETAEWYARILTSFHKFMVAVDEASDDQIAHAADILHMTVDQLLAHRHIKSDDYDGHVRHADIVTPVILSTRKDPSP